MHWSVGSLLSTTNCMLKSISMSPIALYKLFEKQIKISLIIRNYKKRCVYIYKFEHKKVSKLLNQKVISDAWQKYFISSLQHYLHSLLPTVGTSSPLNYNKSIFRIGPNFTFPWKVFCMTTPAVVFWLSWTWTFWMN